MPSETALRSRSRFVYLILVGVAIAIGLVLHSRVIPMPVILRKYSGDGLWALMVFLALGLMFNRASTGRLALAAYCFAAMIEVSQLYHAPWIDSIRATMLGALVLGSTFNWPDFIAYAVGIGVGTIGEIAVRDDRFAICGRRVR
jgi:hypothetical protein